MPGMPEAALWLASAELSRQKSLAAPLTSADRIGRLSVRSEKDLSRAYACADAPLPCPVQPQLPAACSDGFLVLAGWRVVRGARSDLVGCPSGWLDRRPLLRAGRPDRALAGVPADRRRDRRPDRAAVCHCGGERHDRARRGYLRLARTARQAEPGDDDRA